MALLNKLKASQVKAAQFSDRPFKLSDGGGLYLHVQKSGKYWRQKYRFMGKERVFSIGVYPQISLADARLGRDRAKEQINRNIDPVDHRRSFGTGLDPRVHDLTFRGVALDWYHARHIHDVVRSHAERNLGRLEHYVFPHIGRRPITELTPPEVLNLLRRLENKGIVETAHRVKSLIGQIMRHGVASGMCQRDVTTDLRGALRTTKVKHHPALVTPEALGELLRAIDGYAGRPTTCGALRLAPLVFLRPRELRTARWEDIDLNRGVWEVQAKGNVQLLVPLARQAIDILEEMQALNGRWDYVFPATTSKHRPMSDNTITAALKRMDFGGEMTGHGFRAAARTLLVERLRFRVDIVEMQLAHSVRDVHGRAYNRAEWLEDRQEMMQAWADYLDGLRTTSTT